MSRKCDYLECAAERVHKERWELYQIKTMAEYLKEGSILWGGRVFSEIDGMMNAYPERIPRKFYQGIK